MDLTISRHLAVLDYDGDATYVKMLHFLVARENFDPKQAIINACTDFCNTAGSEIYLANCCCFNWGDFDLHVPEEICRRHGFIKVSAQNTTEITYYNDHLVRDDEILSSESLSSSNLKLFYLFPPLDGDYHIWNYTRQWMQEDDISCQDPSLIIHKSLNDADADNRIRKDTGILMSQRGSAE